MCSFNGFCLESVASSVTVYMDVQFPVAAIVGMVLYLLPLIYVYLRLITLISMYYNLTWCRLFKSIETQSQYIQPKLNTFTIFAVADLGGAMGPWPTLAPILHLLHVKICTKQDLWPPGPRHRAMTKHFAPCPPLISILDLLLI